METSLSYAFVNNTGIIFTEKCSGKLKSTENKRGGGGGWGDLSLSIANFSSQYKHITNQTGGENNEVHHLR